MIHRTAQFIFERYLDRPKSFFGLVTAENFTVKVYTITNRREFESESTLEAAIKMLPDWVEKINQSQIVAHQNAFLIVHEAREGVFILLCWWTGGEMLETEIYFSAYDKPLLIIPSIYPNKHLLCVWELEIIQHERDAWIQHILSHPDHPNFDSYHKDFMK